MMTAQTLAYLEEQLEAEEAAVRRFTQYIRLARDTRLREAFEQNRARHAAQCENLRGALRG